MGDQPPEGESVGSDEQQSDPLLPPPTRDASAALMLGILGFASCGLLSPLALYYGYRARQEVEATGGSYASVRNARAAQLMGIVGTVLLITGLALSLVFGLQAWDFLTGLGRLDPPSN